MLSGSTGAGRVGRSRSCGVSAAAGSALAGFCARRERRAAEERGDDEERHLRQTGNQRQPDEHGRRDRQRSRAREQLDRDFLAEVRLRRGARRDQAARHRDEQRRNRGDETFADGQDRVGLRGGAEIEPVLEHADDEAGDDVDAGDQHGRQRVALREANRAVHRAVEVGLAADAVAPRSRASRSSMSPAFRSASIAICRPGIASNVNRAVTSEMRTAPWLMTMN